MVKIVNENRDADFKAVNLLNTIVSSTLSSSNGLGTITDRLSSIEDYVIEISNNGAEESTYNEISKLIDTVRQINRLVGQLNYDSEVVSNRIRSKYNRHHSHNK